MLRGSYVERAGHDARQCNRGAVIFHDCEAHENEVGPAGTVSFNVELDPELWREFTDGVGIVRGIAGRVLGGDIEWPALQVWREFHQPDTSGTLGVEEAIVLLCEATRGASARCLFEPHQRLDRCLHVHAGNRLLWCRQFHIRHLRWHRLECAGNCVHLRR